jgi:hypothetical protein
MTLCLDCGLAISDADRHRVWHGQVEGRLRALERRAKTAEANVQQLDLGVQRVFVRLNQIDP